MGMQIRVLLGGQQKGVNAADWQARIDVRFSGVGGKDGVQFALDKLT